MEHMEELEEELPRREEECKKAEMTVQEGSAGRKIGK